jgi:glycine C-acetyltransferase
VYDSAKVPLTAALAAIREAGTWKEERVILSPQQARIHVRNGGEVLNFCANNYLGLADHPALLDAAHAALDTHGLGMASVRFICGTQDIHKELERAVSQFLGTDDTILYSSCFDANGGLFETLLGEEDAIISDELNHASIIDGIRLAAVMKKGLHKSVYRHSDLSSLRARLNDARSNPDVTGTAWVVTDGVFSMEGDLGDLPGIRKLCDEFGAKLVVDDSHGTGVMGKTGRGTHEHWGMAASKVDYFTGTLGKALGGGAGGYICGSRAATDLLVQRGRPTLFSNALPATIACSADKAIEVLMQEPERVERLRRNVHAVRQGIAEVGFEVLKSPTAICPIIVHDTAKAIAMSRRLLELGVFVIGFGYPVVPEGHARLRVQVSAAHGPEHIEALLSGLAQLKREFA